MHSLILTSTFSKVADELYQKKALPRDASVAFIPTAGDVYEHKPWMEEDRRALLQLGYSVIDVELNSQSANDLKKELEPHNIIFVAGGNTTYLLERAQRSHFHLIIRDLLQDRIYIGSSAGSILAGPTVEPFIDEDISELSKDFTLHNTNALGLVDYVILPHYPKLADANNKIEEKFKNKWRFVKMTDDEYRIESL